MFIRKKLDPAELVPPGQRYDPATGQFQRTNDGGATWINDPGIDPRINPSGQLPPDSPSDTTRCNAAHRMRLAWEDALTQLNGTVSASQFALLVLGLLLPLSGAAGLLADILLAGFDAAVTIGISDINAAFTDALWDEIECDFYCNISQDGSISPGQLAAVIAKIDADHPGDVVIGGAVNIFNSFYGSVLLSNAAVERTETGDCSGCTSCVWQVDFTPDFCAANGITVEFPYENLVNCSNVLSWQAARGAVDSRSGVNVWAYTSAGGTHGVQVRMTLPFQLDSTLTLFEISYVRSSGASAVVQLFVQGARVYCANSPNGTFVGIPSTLLFTGAGGNLTIEADANLNDNTLDVYIITIRLAGTGIPPLP